MRSHPLYNADSAKGYEPLTDDEKDAMSDTEVEKRGAEDQRFFAET